MEMKKMVLVLVSLFILCSLNTVNAMPQTPTCEVYEKPEFVEMDCEGGSLYIGGLAGHKIEIIESPLITPEVKEKLEMDLQKLFIGSVPFGDYKILIDDVEQLNFSYGKNRLASQQYTAIIFSVLLYGGILLIIAGAITAIVTKRKQWILALLLIASGIALWVLLALISMIS